MKDSCYNQLPLGRIFGVLTKKYIGFLAQQLQDSPVERYFYPLFLVATYSGKISQQQLADYLLSDKVSIVRVIDSLEKEGLIERTINQKDRRQHLLCITEKAKPWIDKIEKAVQKTDALFISFLQQDMQEDFKTELINLVKQVMVLPVEEIEVFYSRKKRIKK